MAPPCGVTNWNALSSEVGHFTLDIPTSDFDLNMALGLCVSGGASVSVSVVTSITTNNFATTVLLNVCVIYHRDNSNREEHA